MKAIKIYVNYGDIYAAMGDFVASFYNCREAAEVLHDTARSGKASTYFENLDIVTRCDTDDIETALEGAELVGILSEQPEFCTLDMLIAQIWQAIDRVKSHNEETTRELYFELMCAAYDDDAHIKTEIPAIWLSWLVNADASGMSEEEEQAAIQWEHEFRLMEYFTPDGLDNARVLARIR